MKLYDSGVYLVNGKEIMTDADRGTAEDRKSCHKRAGCRKYHRVWYFEKT